MPFVLFVSFVFPKKKNTMTTVKKDDVQLTYIQQSNEIVDSGTQVMRGSMTMDHDTNLATFVEDCKTKSSVKNPVFWKGKHLSLRIDKEGMLRGTFRVDVPTDPAKCEMLEDCLGLDFNRAIDALTALSKARSPKAKKPKKTSKVA